MKVKSGSIARIARIAQKVPARFRRPAGASPESGGVMFIAVALLAVAVVAVVAFSASYQHQYELDIAYGQAHWVAGMQPLSVEGLIAGATLVIWYAARYGYLKRDVWAAYLVLLAAVGQAAVMNLAADHRYHWPWLGPEISVWPAVAFVAGYEMAVWMVRKRAEAKKTPGAPASLPPTVRGTGTELPPSAPPLQEPRRAARRGPGRTAASVDEAALLARLLASGKPLPSFRSLSLRETGTDRSRAVKRVYEQAQARMNGGGHDPSPVP